MIANAGRAAGVIAGMIVMGACGSSQTGPCGVIFEEALITILRAEDAATAVALPRVSVRSIFIDGQAVADPGILVRVSAPVKGVTVNGSELVCDVACGFAMQEGLYRMNIGAAGYRDTTVTVQAQYAQNNSRNGGCPVRASGGVKLSIELTPT